MEYQKLSMLQKKGDGTSIVLFTALYKQQQIQRKMVKCEDDGLLLAKAPNLGSLTQDSKCDNLNI